MVLITGVLTARRRRISTFFIGCLCCGSLFSILNGKIDPSWHVGKADILSSYCMFDPTMFVRGEVGLNIGLSHFNITYRYSKLINKTVLNLALFIIFFRTFNDPHLNISFNNHFDFFFGGRHQAIYSYKRRAFDLGLPNAMISVAEYMETSGGGFQWASNYPTAGYFAEVALDYALCSNVLQIILIVLIPHVGIRFFFVTGVLMTLSIWIYWFNVPSKTISIVVESNKLELNFGLAFYIILVVGVLDILFSIVIFMLKKCRCMRTISTFFELDYDTPWDNKTIKEDSKQRKEQLASSLATKVFVDSRLRASVRRFRESIRMKRRTKSQSEVNPSKRLVFHEESWMSNHDDLEGSFMQHSDKERTSGLKIPSVLIAASGSLFNCLLRPCLGSRGSYNVQQAQELSYYC